VEDFGPLYWLLCALLLALYVMQLVWMRAIARVLRHAALAGRQAASDLAASVDPAQRFAQAPAGGRSVSAGKDA
jgi:hypothetical protein